MTLYLKYAARSDRGLVRKNNQDSVYAGPRLLAVADGMGGHVGGEVASKVVIAAVEYLDEDIPSANMLTALREATGHATDHLREVVHDKPELEGMGTTLTALLFGSSRIALCHVGDSRAYLLREDKLAQITHDDTFVQALIDEGRITEEEASVHPQRSVILRALNGADVDPSLSIREARAGDRYLLCSDGLTSFVSTETVLSGLKIDDPDQAADSLIDLALRAGGPDNVTVIVADVVDDDDGATPSDIPVVDGAAGDNQGQRENTGSTPASRAALVTQSTQSEADSTEEIDQPASDQARRPRRRRRWWIIALVVIMALGGLFLIARSYVNAQYFVGTRGNDVVIYNGVRTAIGPIDLYSVAQTTSYRVADLNQATQQALASGIDAASLADAKAIVNRLDDQLLPLCTTATPSPSPEPTAPSPTESSSAPPSSDPASSSSGSSSSDSASSSSEKPGINCRGVG